ncbi:hypothetical protein GGG16DRAFT_106767 [Schizophyllum commune]
MRASFLQAPSLRSFSLLCPSSRPPSPPPQTTRPPSPPPPPSLEELVEMSADAIGHLSVHAFKGVLRTNHVPLGQVLEKADLVSKVKALVVEERRMVEERRAREAAERGEWGEREMQEAAERGVGGGTAEGGYAPAACARSACAESRCTDISEGAVACSSLREAETAQPHTWSTPPPAQDGVPPSLADDVPPSLAENAPSSAFTPPKPSPSSPAPSTHAKPSPATSYADRPGLCVVCQDEDAVLAIVDCGHLALCAPCAALIMRSMRECPLCRTRIVTEQRLLRIWRT